MRACRLPGAAFLCAVLALALAGMAQAWDMSPTPPGAEKYDWRWVHGAVFVPTSCVNEAQQWDEYDPVINDRELHYASLYGINCVRVYLHYFIYLKKKDELLRDIDDFLARADKYGIKVEFVFFDDCWREPDPAILGASYQYPPPVFGTHNSRWLLSPGHDALKNYDANRDRLKAYVQDIVRAHKDDPRIAFWETYNEPHPKTPGLLALIKDAQDWVHETGTAIPATATGANFCGDPYSDFLSWHDYGRGYKVDGDPIHAVNTECMQRARQSVSGIVSHYMGTTGFIVWEFGIGRDNCRFTWEDTDQKPSSEEHDAPFHGLVFADGHPWSTDDVKAWLGAEAYAKLPVFKVQYFGDTAFGAPLKESITPAVDFDLLDEIGYGSPDMTIHMPKDHYAMRWTGQIAGDVSSLAVESDGAVKVTINGAVVIDKKAGPGTASAALSPAGQPAPATIQIDYVHETGPAGIHLTTTDAGGIKKPLFPVSHP